MANQYFNGTIAPAPGIVGDTSATIPMATGNSPSNTMPTQTYQSRQTNVIYVNGKQDVLDYPTSPNEHLFFPENDHEIIWVRETDKNGNIQNPLKKLTYTVENVAFGPEANFVTKQEHAELVDLVKDTRGLLAKLVEELGGTK